MCDRSNDNNLSVDYNATRTNKTQFWLRSDVIGEKEHVSWRSFGSVPKPNSSERPWLLIYRAQATQSKLPRGKYPEASDQATVAIWDLRDEKPPYPHPPAVPTLALLNGTSSDKLMLLSIGYRGYLTGEEDLDSLKKAIETILRGEVWANVVS